MWKQLANYAVENLQAEDSQLEFKASFHPYNHTNEYLLIYAPAKTLPLTCNIYRKTNVRNVTSAVKEFPRNIIK